MAYIAAQNPGAAARLADRILAAAAALGKTPSGRAGRLIGTYEKSVSGAPYIVAYTIIQLAENEVVSILRVTHTARHWPKDRWPM